MRETLSPTQSSSAEKTASRKVTLVPLTSHFGDYGDQHRWPVAEVVRQGEVSKVIAVALIGSEKGLEKFVTQEVSIPSEIRGDETD